MNEKQHEISFIKNALHHYYCLLQTGLCTRWEVDFVLQNIEKESDKMGLEITANDVIVKRGDDD